MRMIRYGNITIHDYAPARRDIRADVLAGLFETPKRLPSHYLYDETGAILFERICELDEYYLTRTEMDIMRTNLDSIADALGSRVRLVEPGSGSGDKARLLLEHMHEPAGYVPIDISKEQLVAMATDLAAEFPSLDVSPVCADFTDDYEIPPCENEVDRSVVYFPGSTVGNLEPAAAVDLLRNFVDHCEPHGGVLVGVDLDKDPAIIEPAYDDAEGISRDFALNYLTRLNRELGADFQIDQFDYEAPFNTETSRVEMSLVSLRDQAVDIGATTIAFKDGERIRTENSYKYSLDKFAQLAERAGLSVAHVWTDPDELFSVQYCVSD